MAAQIDALTAYREAQLVALCEKLQLTEILEYIEQPQFDTNSLYYNAAYGKRVAWRVAEILFTLGDLDDFDHLRPHLQMGVVAGLFHRFCYAPHLSSATNIDRAIEGMLGAECITDYFGEHSESVGYIVDAIKITEACDNPKIPVHRIECALNDAVMLDGCEPDAIKNILFDLAEEHNVEITDAIHMQIGWIRQTVMYTEPGRMLWEATVEQRIQAIAALGLQENPPRVIDREGEVDLDG